MNIHHFQLKLEDSKKQKVGICRLDVSEYPQDRNITSGDYNKK